MTDKPLTKQDILSFFEKRGYAALESAVMLGMIPRQRSSLAKAEIGEKVDDVTWALLVRLYQKNPYLLEMFDVPEFDELYQMIAEDLPAITEAEVAQLLGATVQNGVRWTNDGFKRPKIRRLARALHCIRERDGKEGLFDAIETIRLEYELQGKDHSLRSVETIQQDGIRVVVLNILKKHFPLISDRDIAILCGVVEKSGSRWAYEVDVLKPSVLDALHKMHNLERDRGKEGLINFINDQRENLAGTANDDVLPSIVEMGG